MRPVVERQRSHAFAVGLYRQTALTCHLTRHLYRQIATWRLFCATPSLRFVSIKKPRKLGCVQTVTLPAMPPHTPPHTQACCWFVQTDWTSQIHTLHLTHKHAVGSPHRFTHYGVRYLMTSMACALSFNGVRCLMTSMACATS